MDQESSHIYTAEDIARYHSGAMPPAEMHRMEKAALDDPFLSDALEGYVHTQQPARDVAELRQRLARRTRRRVVAMPFGNLAKIAAMVVLLLGFGWIAYYFTTGERQLAVQKEPAPQENILPDENKDSIVQPPPATGPAQDQTATVRVSPPNASKRPAPDQKNVHNTIAKKQEEAAVSGQDIASEDVARAQAPPATAPSSVRSEAVPPKKGNAGTLIKGQVVDANNVAVPNARLQVLNSNTSFLADNNGTFQVPVTDSMVKVSVQSAGYQQGQYELKNNTDNKLVLQSSEGALQEVVVSKKAATRRAAIPRITWDGVSPVTDSTGNNHYELKNLEPFEMGNASISGSVALAFDIDETGKPTNIKIEKSLCDSCDAAAIRILSAGPRLKKTKNNKKARAVVHF